MGAGMGAGGSDGEVRGGGGAGSSTGLTSSFGRIGERRGRRRGLLLERFGGRSRGLGVGRPGVGSGTARLGRVDGRRSRQVRAQGRGRSGRNIRGRRCFGAGFVLGLGGVVVHVERRDGVAGMQSAGDLALEPVQPRPVDRVSSGERGGDERDYHMLPCATPWPPCRKLDRFDHRRLGAGAARIFRRPTQGIALLDEYPGVTGIGTETNFWARAVGIEEGFTQSRGGGTERKLRKISEFFSALPVSA